MNDHLAGYLLTRRIVSWAKWFVKRGVSPGDFCVDATVGNGNDTLFLAECVGVQGKVYGFDIQPTAIENTKQKLTAAGMLERAALIQDSHTYMGNYLAPGTVKAVMFNLGYLPGGDPHLITEPESTVQALEAALHLLKKGIEDTRVPLKSIKMLMSSLQNLSQRNSMFYAWNPSTIIISLQFCLSPKNNNNYCPFLLKKAGFLTGFLRSLVYIAKDLFRCCFHQGLLFPPDIF